MTGAVLITGAASGLGAELASGLAQKGHPVVGVARSSEKISRVHAEITETGGTFVQVLGDVRDAQVLSTAVEAAERLPGGLYGVIANAGIAGPTALLHDISDAEWAETFDVNVTSVFRLCRATVPLLSAHRTGRIIIIGSATGKRPLHARTPYAASKLALVGLARSLAVEVGPSGITVNVVSPWLLEGARLDAVIAQQAGMRGAPADEVREELRTGTATGSTVSAADVLASCEFLLDERNRSITGQDLNVSAGAVMY